MHDAAYLHIRSRDGRATRVVALAEPSVRIGRGRACEVRLDEPALAEVECLLRRRGDTWHLQPVQPAGRLTIDGRPADRPRPLPMGTTLRLLDRWLTLLPTEDDPEPDPGPEPDPAPAVDEPPTPPDPEVAEARSDSLEGRREELIRWEARLKQREQWLRDRQHERTWEARWRAAGASLKNRPRPGGEAAPRPRPSPAPARPPMAHEPPIRPRREVPPPVAEVPAPPRFDRPVPTYQPPTAPPIRPPAPPIARPAPHPPVAEAVPPASPPPTRTPRVRPEAVPPVVEAEAGAIVPKFAPPPIGRVIEIDEEPAGRPEASPGDREMAASPEVTAPPEPAAVPIASVEPIQEPGPDDREAEASHRATGVALPEAPVDPSAPVDGRDAQAEAVDPEEPGHGRASAGLDGPAVPLATARSPGDDGEGAPGIEPPAAVEDATALTPDEAIRPPRAIEDEAAESEDDPAGPATGSGSTELMLTGDRPGIAATRVAVEVEEGPSECPEPAWPSVPVPVLRLDDLVGMLGRKGREADHSGPVVVEVDPVEEAEAPPEARGAADAQAETEAINTPVAEAEPEEAPGVAADPDDPGIAAPGAVVEPPVPAGDWPSARAILGAQPATERRRGGGKPRRSAALPTPTDRIAPDEWTVPGGAWLCIPMMFVALAAGVLGVRLAWTWAEIDRETGRLADRLAGGKRPEAGSIELLLERERELPAASWRNSTADQMIVRAALLSGPGTTYDPAALERAGALIHAAGAASPNHPGLRFARAWRAVQEPGTDPPSAAVGLSRDAWTLAWSGRALLAEGKAEAAGRAYRAALELACRASADASAKPSFHAEREGGRFGLPTDELVGVIVADMADRPEWSADDWRGLVPDFAGAWLVAARLLRQRGDPEADRALERAIALGDGPPPAGCSAAFHEAAAAEAMALDGRLEEAVAHYRGAVGRLSKAEEAARRPWMFNIADLCGRLDDTRGEKAALLAAMITDPNDPVTREAIRAQLRRGVDLVGAGDGEGDDGDTLGE